MINAEFGYNKIPLSKLGIECNKFDYIYSNGFTFVNIKDCNYLTFYIERHFAIGHIDLLTDDKTMHILVKRYGDIIVLYRKDNKYSNYEGFKVMDNSSLLLLNPNFSKTDPSISVSSSAFKDNCMPTDIVSNKKNHKEFYFENEKMNIYIDDSGERITLAHYLIKRADISALEAVDIYTLIQKKTNVFVYGGE